MAATPTATLIDVVVLVFARSELKNLVGTDALRTVLNGSHRAMFPEPNTMSLQPVWELIESQPGFDAEKAIPPMCRIKAWETQLKVKVQLPDALGDIDLGAREKKAMECNVGDDELYKVLKIPATPNKKDVVRAIETSNSGDARHVRGSRQLGLKIAVGFAVLGVAAAGISIYLTLGRSTSNTVKVASSELTSEIPLTDVRRSGKLIVATVTDAKTWLAKPEFERRKQLETMGPKIRMQEANGLMLVDDKGALIAMYKLDRVPPIAFPKQR